MIVINALMKQPVSLSCWGQFDCGVLPVEVRAHDYGLVQTPRGEEYLSVFFVGAEWQESRMSANRALNETQPTPAYERRLRCDLNVLKQMGVDVETIDWSSSSDSDQDRAKWREANLRRLS